MAKLVIGTSKATAVPAIVKTVNVPAPEPYPLLSRVKDDSNNEIGTVCGYHTDTNNQKYAVVCLDAQYRLTDGKLLTIATSYNPRFTVIPYYCNDAEHFLFLENITATVMNDAWLTYFPSQQGNAIAHCRSKSFTIDGVVYYGQLPLLREVALIVNNIEEINRLDSSASQYTSLVLDPILAGSSSSWILSSTRYYYTSYPENGYAFTWQPSGGIGRSVATNSTIPLVVPILEIPINE